MKIDLKGFREFILRGNVVDLAIAVVLGVAFAAVVSSIVGGLLLPLVSAIFGGNGAFENLSFTIHHTAFLYGSVISAIVSFLAIAAVLYFFVVLPVNALLSRRKTEPDVESETKTCPECLSSIPELAIRCAFCTVEQPA